MKNRIKIHARIRKSIAGNASRPRLAVYRSLNNIFGQLIDDESGKTLISASSLKLDGSLTVKAEVVGKEIATAAKIKKITAAVFDRGGFKYSGAVKILCEAARNNGLKI